MQTESLKEILQYPQQFSILCFQHKPDATDSFLDRLYEKAIQIWTGCPYFHVQHIFNGHVYIARTYQGVVKLSLSDWTIDSERYDHYAIPISVSRFNHLQVFLDSQVGKGYDWKGIFFSQALHIDEQDKKKWFCSELVARFLQLSGYDNILNKHAECYSPCSLFQILRKENLLIRASLN